MRIICVGGGPAGLAFALALKQHRPEASVTIFERSAAGARQGFGIVLSDGLSGRLHEVDGVLGSQLSPSLRRWEGIDVLLPDVRVHCPGFALNGMSRELLIRLLVARCVAKGIRLVFQHDVTSIDHLRDADLVVAADGVNSFIRDLYGDTFGSQVSEGGNRFAWLGTTRSFERFTFSFRENRDGLWWFHAYQYGPVASTFIVEGTQQTWSRAQLPVDDESRTTAYFQRLFAEELEGHPLVVDRSIWRSFPTVTNRVWAHDNIVLVGDCAHTAHFSIGSGMRLAVDGAIELARALGEAPCVVDALRLYESRQRPRVERAQTLAKKSMSWFEQVGQLSRDDPASFTSALINRAGVHSAAQIEALELSYQVGRYPKLMG